MPTTTVSKASLDTSSFKRFAKALRAAEPELASEFRKSLRLAGGIIAGIAQRNAAWSTKIPGTIKSRTSGASVTVVAGGPNAPAAAAFEHGGNSGVFRHPVFGTDTWVNQPARPFLKPAVDEGTPAAQKAAVDALDLVVGKIASASSV